MCGLKLINIVFITIIKELIYVYAKNMISKIAIESIILWCPTILSNICTVYRI